MRLSDEDMRQVLKYRNRPERKKVMEDIGLDPKSARDHALMYRIFRAIGDVVRVQGKCVFPGLGTFEWRPRHGVTPDGRRYSSSSLRFALTRADRRK